MSYVLFLKKHHRRVYNLWWEIMILDHLLHDDPSPTAKAVIRSVSSFSKDEMIDHLSSIMEDKVNEQKEKSRKLLNMIRNI